MGVWYWVSTWKDCEACSNTSRVQGKCMLTLKLLSSSFPDSQYLTCRMQNCTDANRNKPFPGYIDPDSLIVQDDYVFVQVRKPYVCSFAEGISSLCLVIALSACLHTLKGKEEMDWKGRTRRTKRGRKWKREGGEKEREERKVGGRGRLTDCLFFSLLSVGIYQPIYKVLYWPRRDAHFHLYVSPIKPWSLSELGSYIHFFLSGKCSSRQGPSSVSL